MCAPALPSAEPSRDGRALVSPLQCGDVELLHLQHCRQRRLRVSVLRVTQHLGQDLGHDLPREPEAVLAPAARPFLAAIGRESVPVLVHLRLVLARDHQREAFGECECRPAVEGQVLAPVELERRAKYLALLDRTVVGLGALDAQHTRVREQRYVEVNRLFGVVGVDDARLDHLRFSFFFLSFCRRSSAAPNRSRRPSQIARYVVTNSESSRNGSGRNAYSLRRPSGRTTTKSASSRICSCLETPGCPMSTTWTSSLTDRSPPRRASTMRRRVGSARTWNTSGTAIYYSSNIFRVNNTSSPFTGASPPHSWGGGGEAAGGAVERGSFTSPFMGRWRRSRRRGRRVRRRTP